MKGISGKVALLTGGSRGIGAGVAEALVAGGAKVSIGDILDEEGTALARRLGADCRYRHADLREDRDLERLVDETVQAFGAIDFLINAACTYADSGFAADRAQWQEAFNVNLFGHAVLLQYAHRHLCQSENASVVNFTTEAAHAGLAGRWVYPSSKAAIEQLTRSQAVDLARDGIRVNSVLHGWTRKPFHDSAPPEVLERYQQWARRLHILGRMGSLEEAADAVLFLCSDHARFMTGSCLTMDGGHNALGPQGIEIVLPSELRKAAGSAAT